MGSASTPIVARSAARATAQALYPSQCVMLPTTPGRPAGLTAPPAGDLAGLQTELPERRAPPGTRGDELAAPLLNRVAECPFLSREERRVNSIPGSRDDGGAGGQDSLKHGRAPGRSGAGHRPRLAAEPARADNRAIPPRSGPRHGASYEGCAAPPCQTTATAPNRRCQSAVRTVPHHCANSGCRRTRISCIDQGVVVEKDGRHLGSPREPPLCVLEAGGAPSLPGRVWIRVQERTRPNADDARPIGASQRLPPGTREGGAEAVSRAGGRAARLAPARRRFQIGNGSSGVTMPICPQSSTRCR